MILAWDSPFNIGLARVYRKLRVHSFVYCFVVLMLIYFFIIIFSRENQQRTILFNWVKENM